MSEDDTPPPRFTGHTYSRSRQSAAGRAFDEADNKSVPVKAAVSISKWGKANYVPFREGSDGASEVKRRKMENRGEDPFSFDTEDKSKVAPVKKPIAVAQQPETRQSTRLPASRIVVKGEGVESLQKTDREEGEQFPAFRTYSRTSPKKPVIMDQFVEVGKTTVTSSGKTFFMPSSQETKKETKLEMEEDDDDDIFPIQFKREPIKTYTGEVVTPVDKPDTPPPRKSRYVRKGGPRGRKPLTVSDPGLIEEYKRNYAAQQLQRKPDTSTGGLNNSMVVSKKEVANEDQGTTVVVVCKPRAQLEKCEVQTKYFSKTSKVPKGTLVPVSSDMSSQESGENGNSDPSSISENAETVPTRTSARLRNVVTAANSDGISSPSSSASSALTPTPVSPNKRISRGRNPQTESASSSQSAPTSTDSNSQGDSSAGRGGKRYRIFKSRAPQVEEDELKPPVFGGDLEDEESPLPSSEQNPSNMAQDEADKNVLADIDMALDETQPPSLTPVTSQISDSTETTVVEIEVDPSQFVQKGGLRSRKPLTVSDPGGLNNSSEREVATDDQGNSVVVVCKPKDQLDEARSRSLTPDTTVVEIKVDPVNIKLVDPAAARELLAARLRNMEKGNDSDSTGEPDNLSECSENLMAHSESPSNSQSTQDEGSQKDNSGAPPRRFFKSKKSLSGSSDLQRKIFGGSPQKSPAKATYNARSWYSEHEAEGEKESVPVKKSLIKDTEDIVLVKDSAKGPKLKREVHWPEQQYDEAYTSLRVSKTHKELYTVVHNVKQTHEVQELGETQDFIDEVDYLLDSLRDRNSTSIRCLSCLKLAGKCISPAFRMHMRAHGTVTKIFSLLHDACSDPCLALSTSTMMFMLSRDRLNMDLDQDSLNLMLKLNEVDSSDKFSSDASNLKELEKTKVKVQELLAQLQQETHAKEIDLGFVSTGNLAMESLLSLTSRRAGEWFKEELRSAGGLDYIVDSVNACEESLSDDLTQDIQKSLPVLRKLDRCLRVLENISFMNSDNQSYLISYKNASLLQSCNRTLWLCQKCMPSYKVLETVEDNKAVKDLPGYTVLTCMLAVLRVLLNLTHEHKLGNLDPATETSLMETILKCLTSTQWCIPMEQRFDMAVLCLGLLINLVEHRAENRRGMVEIQTQVKYREKMQPRTMTAIKAIVELFVQREEAAREMEEDTEGTPDTSVADSPNKSGEWKESDSGIQWITNNLKKAKEEEEKLKKESRDSKEVADEGNQSILEDDEETFTKALHKAGKHMENSIVASYAGLLIGTTIIESKEYAAEVKQLIPNQDFGPMIKMLKKFLNFMSLTTAFGSTDVNGITRVIQVLEAA